MEKVYIHETNTDRYLRGIVGRLGISKNAQVLNLACEKKLIPDFLQGTIDNNNVRGVDLDKKVVDGTKVLSCDVDREPLPFNDGSFDLVVSVWGFEHFASTRVLREANRVLKSGGILIFVTPNILSPLFALKRILGHRFTRWYYRRVLRSPYQPHATHYRLNRVRAIKYALPADLHFQTAVYLGPAHALYYANFSPLLQRFMSGVDRMFLTNPLLGWKKPYLVGVLIKQ